MDNAKEPKEQVAKIIGKIKELRKQKGYSNEAMAVDLDMSTSAYNKLERMESVLSLERFIKIREILEVPYSDFFEIGKGNVYKQDLKDNSVGHCEIQNLHQDNRETMQKLIQTLEGEIEHLKSEVIYLRKVKS